jgi:hypothetical protein
MLRWISGHFRGQGVHCTRIAQMAAMGRKYHFPAHKIPALVF